jgi:hypothetical protein
MIEVTFCAAEHRAGGYHQSHIHGFLRHPFLTPLYHSLLRVFYHPHMNCTRHSSWLKSMNKLSGLIDRLEELASASSTPAESCSQLSRLGQVATLRATLNSTKIRQSSFSLDMLEKRLDMAKTLPRQAVDLRKSHESGTAGTIQVDAITGPGARETGQTSSFYL